MAYNDYRSNYQNQSLRQARQSPDKELHPPLELPQDYVEKAEQVMKGQNYGISTSKIRSFLSIANDIYTSESKSKDENLKKDSIEKLNMMRVRIIYEAGRYKDDVKPFVEDSKLINYIKSIGTSRKKFINFFRYLEALVAYHRFFNERDN